MYTSARPERYAYLAIAAVSFSMLTYQILLTRISALRLLFHFAFLIISNCLLAIGAAGSVIALFRERWEKVPRQAVWIACGLYALSLVLAYVFLLQFWIPPKLDFGNPYHLTRFTLFNLVAAVPFFFGGLAVGMILTFHAIRVNRLYASDLVAAGLGCIACPFLLSAFGAGGCLVVATLAALAATLVATPPAKSRAYLWVGAGIALLSVWALPRLDTAFPVPGKGDLELTPSYTVNLSDVSLSSQWSATSRIDLVPIVDEGRFIPGLGRNAIGKPIPDTRFILQDGSAGTFSFNFSGEPQGLETLRQSLYYASVGIKEKPRVFIIGVGGLSDVWAARAAGARSIRGIELNQPILDLHHTLLREFSRDVIEDPTIELIHDEGRSALMRDPETYDVIQLTGIDTWTSLTSGAYVLAENYLYTQEAIEELYGHLAPGGILHITRFARAMEVLRLLATVDAAVESLGGSELAQSVIGLKGPDHLFTLMVKKGAFSPEEIADVTAYAENAGFDILYRPGQAATNLPSRFILTPDRKGFIQSFRRDISPTTDDRPYFFSFTRWRDLLSAGRVTGETAAISQGNPVFLLGQALLSALLAALFIFVPLAVSRHRNIDRTHAGRFLVYFSCLGAGFIAIEVSLIQKLTLFLGHPLYSITVTLFCILVFSGLGSLISERWFAGERRGDWRVPLALVAVLILFVTLATPLFKAGMGLPFALRAGLTVLVLAPIGILLGVPFAYGIRLLNRSNPTLIPWAWAVNGSLSVVGSILTVIISMNFGFAAVLLLAGLLYPVAFLALPSNAALGRGNPQA